MTKPKKIIIEGGETPTFKELRSKLKIIPPATEETSAPPPETPTAPAESPKVAPAILDAFKASYQTIKFLAQTEAMVKETKRQEFIQKAMGTRIDPMAAIPIHPGPGEIKETKPRTPVMQAIGKMTGISPAVLKETEGRLEAVTPWVRAIFPSKEPGFMEQAKEIAKPGITPTYQSPTYAEAKLGLGYGTNIDEVMKAPKPEGMSDQEYEYWQSQVGAIRYQRLLEKRSLLEAKLDPTSKLPPLPRAFTKNLLVLPKYQPLIMPDEAAEVVDWFAQGNLLPWLRYWFGIPEASDPELFKPDESAIIRGAASLLTSLWEAAGAIVGSSLRSTALLGDISYREYKKTRGVLLPEDEHALSDWVEYITREDPYISQIFYPRFQATQEHNQAILYNQLLDAEYQLGEITEEQYKWAKDLSVVKPSASEFMGAGEAMGGLILGMIMLPVEFAHNPIGFTLERPFEALLVVSMAMKTPKMAAKGITRVSGILDYIKTLRKTNKLRKKIAKEATGYTDILDVMADQIVKDEGATPAQEFIFRYIEKSRKAKTADEMSEWAQKYLRDNPEVSKQLQESADIIRETFNEVVVSEPAPTPPEATPRVEPPAPEPTTTTPKVEIPTGEPSAPPSGAGVAVGLPRITLWDKMVQMWNLFRRVKEVKDHMDDMTWRVITEQEFGKLKGNPAWDRKLFLAPLDIISKTEGDAVGNIQIRGFTNLERVKAIAERFDPIDFIAIRGFIDENGLISIWDGNHRLAAIRYLAENFPERYPTAWKRITPGGQTIYHVPLELFNITRGEAALHSIRNLVLTENTTPFQIARFAKFGGTIAELSGQIETKLGRKPLFHEIVDAVIGRTDAMTATRKYELRQAVGIYFAERAFVDKTLFDVATQINPNMDFWTAFGEHVYNGKFELLGIEPETYIRKYYEASVKASEGKPRMTLSGQPEMKLEELTKDWIDGNIKALEEYARDPETTTKMMALKQQQGIENTSLFGDLSESIRTDILDIIDREAEFIRVRRDELNGLEKQLKKISKEEGWETKPEAKRIIDEINVKRAELVDREARIRSAIERVINNESERYVKSAEAALEELKKPAEEVKPEPPKKARPAKKKKPPVKKVEPEPAEAPMAERLELEFELEVEARLARPMDRVEYIGPNGKRHEGFIETNDPSFDIAIVLREIKPDEWIQENIPRENLIRIVKPMTPETAAKIKKIVKFDPREDPTYAIKRLVDAKSIKLLFGAMAGPVLYLDALSEEDRNKILAGNYTPLIENLNLGRGKRGWGGWAQIGIMVAGVPLGVLAIRTAYLLRRRGRNWAVIGGELGSPMGGVLVSAQTSIGAILNTVDRFLYGGKDLPYDLGAKDIPPLWKKWTTSIEETGPVLSQHLKDLYKMRGALEWNAIDRLSFVNGHRPEIKSAFKSRARGESLANVADRLLEQEIITPESHRIFKEDLVRVDETINTSFSALKDTWEVIGAKLERLHDLLTDLNFFKIEKANKVQFQMAEALRKEAEDILTGKGELEALAKAKAEGRITPEDYAARERAIRARVQIGMDICALRMVEATMETWRMSRETAREAMAEKGRQVAELRAQRRAAEETGNTELAARLDAEMKPLEAELRELTRDFNDRAEVMKAMEEWYEGARTTLKDRYVNRPFAEDALLSEVVAERENIPAETTARITEFFEKHKQEMIRHWEALGLERKMGEPYEFYVPVQVMKKFEAAYRDGLAVSKVTPDITSYRSMHESPTMDAMLHRSWEVPFAIMERNLAQVMGNYITQYARMMAWTEVFRDFKEVAKVSSELQREMARLKEITGTKDYPDVPGGDIGIDVDAIRKRLVYATQTELLGKNQWKKYDPIVIFDEMVDGVYRFLEKQTEKMPAVNRMIRLRRVSDTKLFDQMQTIAVSSMLGAASTMVWNILGGGTEAGLRSNKLRTQLYNLPIETAKVIMGGRKRAKEILGPRVSIDFDPSKGEWGRLGAPYSGMQSFLVADLLAQVSLDFTNMWYQVMRRWGGQTWHGLIEAGLRIYNELELGIRASLYSARYMETLRALDRAKAFEKGRWPTFEEFAKETSLDTYQPGSMAAARKYFNKWIEAGKDKVQQAEIANFLADFMGREFVRQTQHIHGTMQNIAFYRKMGPGLRSMFTFSSFPVHYLTLMADTLGRGKWKPYINYLASGYLACKLFEQLGIDTSSQLFGGELLLPTLYNLSNKSLGIQFGPFNILGPLWQPVSDLAHIAFFKWIGQEEEYREKKYFYDYWSFKINNIPGLQWFPTEIPETLPGPLGKLGGGIPLGIPPQYVPMGRLLSGIITYRARDRRVNDLIAQGRMPEWAATPPGQTLLKTIGFPGHALIGSPAWLPPGWRKFIGKTSYMDLTAAQRAINREVAISPEKAADALLEGRYMGLYWQVYRSVFENELKGAKEEGLAGTMGLLVKTDIGLETMLAMMGDRAVSPSAVEEWAYLQSVYTWQYGVAQGVLPPLTPAKREELKARARELGQAVSQYQKSKGFGRVFGKRGFEKGFGKGGF